MLSTGGTTLAGMDVAANAAGTADVDASACVSAGIWEVGHSNALELIVDRLALTSPELTVTAGLSSSSPGWYHSYNANASLVDETPSAGKPCAKEDSTNPSLPSECQSSKVLNAGVTAAGRFEAAAVDDVLTFLGAFSLASLT